MTRLNATHHGQTTWQAGHMHVVHPQERSIPDALALSHVLLKLAEQQGTVMLGASLVKGPAVILGAMQRAGRVVDVRACNAAGVHVLRRETTGTAAWMGGTGLVLALGLPNVASIEDDATARTLLNRNVRPFLRAFTRAGAMAHYFGREWISFKKQPGALLGFDVTRTGAVLIEVFVGFDQAIGLPMDLATPDERAIDRFHGKKPVSLREVFPDAQWKRFVDRAFEGLAGASSSPLEVDDATLALVRREPMTDDRDPVPDGFVCQTLQRVPIGYVDRAVSQDEPSRKWLGGDVLAPRWLYADLAAGIDLETISSVAIDGAQREDLVRALSNA